MHGDQSAGFICYCCDVGGFDPNPLQVPLLGFFHGNVRPVHTRLHINVYYTITWYNQTEANNKINNSTQDKSLLLIFAFYKIKNAEWNPSYSNNYSARKLNCFKKNWDFWNFGMKSEMFAV